MFNPAVYEFAAASGHGTLTEVSTVRLLLDPEESVPLGMLAVEAGRYDVPLLGSPLNERVLERFWIDRTEVTNAQFKEFVDAGGYRRPEFWNEEFVEDTRTLPFEEAMTRFRDPTGEPGPATWVQGEYEAGKGNHPVAGVSWFEAAAYAEFHGKRLPTLYHWARAALPAFETGEPLAPSIVALSNLGGTGPAPVGTYNGIGTSGVLDIAGNVREWTWTTGTGGRYVLGGAWSDPIYTFSNLTVASPWTRVDTNGFRCAIFPAGESAESLMAPLFRPVTDFYATPPVSDEVFAATRAPAAYRRRPLNLVRELSQELPGGMREERVTVDAAYGRERLILRLRLPTSVDPPYQAVVWFGGGEALTLRDTDQSPLRDLPDLFVRSGRAVVMPVWAGTYERNDGRTLDEKSSLGLGIKWIRDLGRTLDYLEEREDIDAERVAYSGISLGSTLAPFLLAGETRVRAAVLWAGGFGTPQPGAAPATVSWVRRTTIPTLMLNGRHDFVFPFESRQKPMFDLLGAPDENKRHVVYDAGHWPLPRNEVIRESVNWLDRYLGPVQKSEG